MTSITLYHLESQRAQVAVPNLYRVNTSGQFVWLQRLAHRILAKWGRLHYADVVETKTVHLPLDGLVQAVIRNQADAFQIFHRQAKTLVIGRDEWYRLTHDREVPFYWFQIPPDYTARLKPPDARTMFRGLDVVIVPWIDGLFVLPELRR